MSRARVIELPPIIESTQDYDTIERRIKAAFRKLLYAPLLKALGSSEVLANESDAIYKAIRSGRIRFERGRFTGKFNATISKELKALGARWDKAEACFRITRGELPPEVATAIVASEAQFLGKLKRIDAQMAQLLPEEIAEHVRASDMFDSTLWRVDRKMGDTLKGITVAPELTADQRKKIADEWEENLRLDIKNFAEKEILELRQAVKKAVYSGQRYEATAKAIRRSYGVTEGKAKFLARQETALLMAKHKEARYTSAGVHEYKWKCVIGSKLHPVRPAHRALDGTVQRWDAPPITTGANEPQRRNNPGQDYNCRCMAIPIVRFKSEKT